MRNLRPDTPRVVFRDWDHIGSTLAMWWDHGIPTFQTTPHRLIYDPKSFIQKWAHLYRDTLSRRRRRYVKRWLKDAWAVNGNIYSHDQIEVL